MKTRRLSLSVKFLALYVGALTLVGVIAGAAQYRAVQGHLYEQVETSAANLVTTMEDIVAEAPQLFREGTFGPMVQRFARKLPDVARLSVRDHHRRFRPARPGAADARARHPAAARLRG